MSKSEEQIRWSRLERNLDDLDVRRGRMWNTELSASRTRGMNLDEAEDPGIE